MNCLLQGATLFRLIALLGNQSCRRRIVMLTRKNVIKYRTILLLMLEWLAS